MALSTVSGVLTRLAVGRLGPLGLAGLPDEKATTMIAYSGTPSRSSSSRRHRRASPHRQRLGLLHGCWRRRVRRPPGPTRDLSQHLVEQPPDGLPLVQFVKTETQRKEWMVREQIGYLVAYASSIGGPSHRSREETAQLGKLDLGQPPPSQSLGA